ncbi:hypothetical protein BUALT_Bualt11G0066500 [Buddleja alternifolia]|uniref:VQ domain-containing protein n=1 Tax=Buddleja alternifolia TaxID=168488 RepID=A0AAV6WXU6_9LAMI|nr:hypothetical protein BUALT_Bualt11G0066500 [Buddleja alternifolia]
MDSYSYNVNTTSSFYSYSSIYPTPFPNDQYQQGINIAKPPLPPPAFRSELHSVRKAPAKNLITKKPNAPLPPTPPKIYTVDPIDFRDVVQKLTCAPEFIPTRLREVAPPPLSHLSQPPVKAALSPSSLAWCSSIFFSPGNSSLEPSAII